MAHFYGRVQGGKGEATRCGTKNSGLRVSAATWDYKICVYLHHVDGKDTAHVDLVPLNGGAGRVLFSSSHPLDAGHPKGWKEHLLSLLEHSGMGDEIMREYAERKLRERSDA